MYPLVLVRRQQKKMAAERAERKRAKNKRKKQARQERKRMEREFKEAPIRATVKSTLTALNPVNLVSSVYTMAVSLVSTPEGFSTSMVGLPRALHDGMQGTSMAGIGDISQTPQKKKISKLEKKLKKMEEKMEQLETTLPTVQHAQHGTRSMLVRLCALVTGYGLQHKRHPRLHVLLLSVGPYRWRHPLLLLPQEPPR